MGGYRQSSYDPDSYDQPGPPLTPFNGLQWAGVALGAVGIGLFLLYVAGRLGWTAPIVATASSGIVPTFAGYMLVNSRRGPSIMVDDVQRDRNRKILFVTLAICAAILGAALVIEFQGA
ncbi:hypothetical protein [Sphingomonas xanthus]|uniref:Uncharacterized protein n=1 Tax=Sphingomonas xanthus TaxID=2594473 RepID=A0A516IR00_9SPHN|nr:hypothetical protein [Sphingomonas xanthus]QDP19299.1 hypothetical protein FMM02_04560 [Sphingomonas xanthus]